MSSETTREVYRHFISEFHRASDSRKERRIGSELKYPFVDSNARAVRPEQVDSLWSHLIEQGWSPDTDEASGAVVGARLPGERNETVASCETGYCKTEFSLAHSENIHSLDKTRNSVTGELRRFLRDRDLHLLCYGAQPLSPPSSELLMKKMRAGFWDKALPSNNVIPKGKGDDVHLFTINACSHVHVSACPEEAVRAVNVLNGFAGAQLSLTANSPSRFDWTEAKLKCLNEKLWDWWEPVRGRVGIPEKPFEDLEDYVSRICCLPPIYVKRDGAPVILCHDHHAFSDYLSEDKALGRTVDGCEIRVEPGMEDVSTHNSCYWYTARISRYFTVENRVFDQQPPDAQLAPAALTLGLVCAAAEAWEELSSYDWAALREMRELACAHGMDWNLDGVSACDIAGRMLEIAEKGLKERDNGEQEYLAPFKNRIRECRCPADDAVDIPDSDWPGQLLEKYSL